MKKPSHHVTFLSRFLAHLAIICLVFNPIALSAQTLPITPDGSTATQVTHTSSGIDQINIAAPNSSGLSHNTFTDYNVNTAGQVINNFSGKDPSEVVEGTGGVGVALTSSNIAGLVAVNPNLSSSGSARIILNEVTSSNDSQLLGYTEIAGTKAELIIANPNGITCSGCGFINTSRLSMIAGKSEFDQNGNLGFNLENQSPSADLKIPLITISGLGLDAESTSATDIIASSIKLISTIYGSETTDITLKTGSGKYDTATKDLRLTTDDLPLAAQPLFALDATNLGAIQSGRIFIVATQDGFGVNLGKNLLATKSLNIDSAGNLYYENLTSPKINIKATSNITQSGNIVTSGNLDIETTKTFTNFGILKSDTDINLTANSLENSFLINAKNITINTENFLNKNGGIIGSFSIQNEDGTTSQFNTERGEFVGKNFSNFGNVKARDLAFNISHLTNSGIIRSINDLRLTTVDLNNSGEISSQTNLNIEAAGNIGNTNKIFSNEALNISATKLTNSGDAAIASLASSLVFHLKTNLENNGELYSKKNLTIEVDELSNFGNIFSEENLTSNVYQLTNYGILQSIGDLQLTAFRLENYNSIKSFKTLTIDAHASMNDALIFSAGNLTFNIPYLTNYGTIQSTDNLQLATTSLRNSGNIFANNDLDITSSNLENKADSTIASINKSLTFNLSDQLINAGIIFAKENFSLKNSYTDSEISSVNNSGNISFDQLLGDLKIKNFINSGTINSAQNLTITSSENFNNLGNILGAKDLSFSISHLTNSGIIQSIGDLRLTVVDLENTGSIKSFKNFTIDADSLANQIDALIFSADNLTISASNSLTNSGSIFSNAKLDLTSGLATNNSEIFSVGDLKFTLTKDLNNTGSVNSLSNLDISSNSSITSSNQILSSGNLTLSAGNLTNSNNIQSGGNLTLNLATLSNLKNIISGGDFNVTASGNISNSSTLQSANNFTINAANLTNSTSSLISSGKDLTIKAATITNKNTRAADNSTSSGLIAINGIITLQTDSLNNDSGMIAAKSTILNPLTSGKNVILSNILGKFFSTNSISLNLGTASYTITGELSAKDIDITANNITNLGNVTANDFIKLNAIGSAAISNGNVTNGVAGGNNSNVKLSAGSYLTAIANRFILNYGTISANTDLTLTSNYSEIRNYGTITGGNGITTLNALNFTAGEFNNYTGAKLTANNNLTINAKNLNNFGEISVRNDLVVTVPQNLYNNPTALIWSGRDATFNVANNFVNTQAEIYAERNLTIRGNDLTAAIQNKTYLDQNMTYLFQNISGNIETYSGDILIKAMNFYNGRKDGNPALEVAWNETYRVCNSNVSWCQHGEYRLPLGVFLGNHNLFNWISLGSSYSNYAYAARRKENNDLKTIYSGKDLTIQSDAFTNEVANIFSAKNMNIASQRFFGNLSKTYGGMFFSDSYNSEHCGGSWGCFKYWKNYYDNPYFFTTYNALIKSGASLTGTVSSQINNNTIAQNTAINSISQLSKSTTFNQFDRFTITQTGIINLDLSRIISAINSNSNQKSIQSQAIEFKTSSLIAVDQVKSLQLSTTELSNNQIFDKINLGSLSINGAAFLAANPLTPLVEARSQFTNIENYYGSDYLFIKLGLTKEQFLTQLSAAAEKLRLEKEEEEKIVRLAKEAEEQKLTEEEKKRRAAESEQARIANQSNQKLLQPARFLGDSFTESKLLKEQLSSLRKDALLLSDDNSDPESEIKSLLDNTATELKKLNLTLAEVATKGLTQSQINSLEKDIITFESINLNGMNIIVPKIYLSLKTRDKLLGSSTTPSSLARSAEDLMSSGSFATSSTIFAKGDLTLNSPTASLLNTGSIISGKNMTLSLASLKNKTDSSTIAEIKSGNNLTITTINDLKNLGASITAKNNLTLTSLKGNILNSSIVQTNASTLLSTSDAALLASNSDSYQLRFGDSARSSGNIQSSLISTASLTAKNIEITSANNFTNLAAKITSSEDLKIETGNDINIGTLQLHNRTEEHWGSKKKGGDRITDSTTNLQSEITSSGNIEITSQNNTTIQAAKLKAEDDISITANNLLLTTAQNTSFKMESIRKNKTFTFKNNDNGNINSEVLNNEITASNGTTNLTAQNTAYIEFKSGTNPLAPYGYSATSSQLQNLKAETILQNPIDEIHKSWNKTNSGLNQTGMITVGVIATAATAGAAIYLAPAAMGTWATIGYAAGTAGASAATSTASVSTTNSAIDGKNFSQTSKQVLKDTTSKDSLENIAIAATTAALVAGASQASGLSNAAKVANTTNTTTTTTSTIERVATNFSTGLQKAGIYSSSNIIATSVIKGQSINDTIEQQGGGEKILLNSALNALAETGAKEIGLAAHTDQINKSTQLILHAGLGATIAAARGSDNTAGILAGAAAAVVGEAAGDVARNNNIDKGAGVAIAQGAGALASLTTLVAMGEGDDDTAKNVGIGASIGANAAANNAYFGERPLNLSDKKAGQLLAKGLARIDLDSADKANIKPAHEHLFFEDEQGGNLGYFSNNKVQSDDPKFLSLYKPTITDFDDTLMREAVQNVQPKPYSLLGVDSCTGKYNCQDWSAAVRSEYYHLETQKNLEIWNQLTRPQVNLNQAKQ